MSCVVGWHCAGCGKAADGLIKTCDCQTMVGCRTGEGGRPESTWLIGAATDLQIKHMVDRFLQWRLPENFRPDHGISYTNPYPHIPTLPGPMGTNLFDAVQAEAMVRFMIDGEPRT